VKQKLTERQRAVYDFIRAYQRKYGRSPTYREIVEHGKHSWSNATSVASHVNALKRKGWIENKQRVISMPDGAKHLQMNLSARNRVLDKLTQLGQEMGEYE